MTDQDIVLGRDGNRMPSGPGASQGSDYLSDGERDEEERQRRGKFAEQNDRRAATMLYLAIGFLALASAPYLLAPCLAIVGLVFPGALGASVSVREAVPPLGFPAYILALPFAVAVAFAFLAGFQSGMRGKGTIGSVGFGSDADGS